MTTHLQSLVVRAAVSAQVAAADVGARIAAVADRLERVDGGAEHGAQAAEYAMLGGVSAAACTGLVAIFKNRETLRALVDSVIGVLGSVIEGWF